MSTAGTTTGAFNVRTMLALVALGIVGFVSFLLLSAYSEDLRPAQGSGTHALSVSAVGFAGAVELVDRVYGKVGLIRREIDLDDPQRLVVLTPDIATDPATLDKILDRRSDYPTIVVLPKWRTVPRQDKPNWVRTAGTYDPADVARLVASLGRVRIGMGADGLRTIDGEGLAPLLTDGRGQVLAAHIRGRATIIVADPDLLDNHGLATLAGAERAMTLLGRYAVDGNISFDLTLHGFGRNPNLLKLAFEPPFLPLTLCLFAAALLAGWHAMQRFGQVAADQRGIAFGKRGIVENGAALLRLTRRGHRTGHRYAALIRENAAAATGAPPSLTGVALDEYLDWLSPIGEPFSAIADRAAAAPDTRSLLAAAQALFQWKRKVTRVNR